MRFKIDWASLIVGSKFIVFTLFYFVLEGNFPSTSPRGAYIWRSDLTEGFLRYVYVLRYIWRGLYIHGGAYFRNFTVFRKGPLAMEKSEQTRQKGAKRDRFIFLLITYTPFMLML